MIVLLSISSALSLAGFWGDKSGLRMFHAYLGTVTLGLLVIHTVLGVKLGLSL